MADIKNFSLAGVGSDVQFGKRGSKLVHSTGEAFAFRDSNDSSFVTVKVATPTLADHAATKRYVDSIAQGLDPKQSVVAATTAPITLTGEQTVDGVAVVTGDRVLVKSQTSPEQNGIYVVSAGSWTRAIDADEDGKVTSGMFTFIEKGTTLANTGWVLATNDPITVGSTSLAFVQFSAAGVSQAGDGLSQDGNTFNVNAGDGIKLENDAVAVKLDGSTLAVGANGVKVSDAVMQRISDAETAISGSSGDIGALESRVTTAEADIDLVEGRVTGTEGRLTTAEADIDQIQADIAGLDKTQIYADDGTKVDTDGVPGKVTVDAAGKRVAAFESGVSGDSSITFNGATAGKVSFDAYSGTATDVDIHLNPLGAGAVLLGDAATHGLIQTDAGMTLTLAGGDDAAGNGGDVTLRAGRGITPEVAGTVRIENGVGADIATFHSPDTATASYVFTAGTTTTTLSSAGVEANIDMVLAPKGTGAVSVNGAVVANVATPVVGTDGVNKDYVDTATSALAQSLIGTVQTREITVSTASMNIGSVIKGRVRRAMLQITTPYSGGTQLTIGTSGNQDQIVSANDIDETAVGIYDLNVSVDFPTDTQLQVFISGGPATGAAVLVVEYIQA